MTSFDRFEHRIPALLDELATPRLPDYADDLFARTAATRQRPGWTFPERWISMSAITSRLAAAPRVPWRLGVLVALLAVAAVVGVLVAGAILNPRPAPYGPAANGQFVFVDDGGRVVVGDQGTAATHVVADLTGGTSPLFSQDGTRIAFLRDRGTGGQFDLMVVKVDGTDLLQVNNEAILAPSYVGWSATGDALLIHDVSKRLVLYDATKLAEPFVLSEALDVRVAGVGLGYNFRSTSAFRPPSGQEILVVAGTGQGMLQAARADGTGLRTLLDPGSVPFEYLSITGGEWSPDGSQIVAMFEKSQHISQPYVLDADGTGLRPLSDLFDDPYIGINSPLWSPDGTRIAFQYWTQFADGRDQEYHPIAVVDVATGELHDVGPVVFNGYVSWQWSPDGRSILEVPQDGSGEILIVDATTGLWETAPWTIDQPIDWQRVAP